MLTLEGGLDGAPRNTLGFRVSWECILKSVRFDVSRCPSTRSKKQAKRSHFLAAHPKGRWSSYCSEAGSVGHRLPYLHEIRFRSIALSASGPLSASHLSIRRGKLYTDSFGRQRLAATTEECIGSFVNLIVVCLIETEIIRICALEEWTDSLVATQ